MKTIICSVCAALSLITVAAHAEGEGNGDPFPFRVGGVITMSSPGSGAQALASSAALSPGTAQALDTAQSPVDALHR